MTLSAYMMVDPNKTVDQVAGAETNDPVSAYDEIAGVALLAAGVDFSELSPQEIDELTVPKITDMFVVENSRRFRRIKQALGDFAIETRDKWRLVREVKTNRLWGPLGCIVHYVTHLDSDTEELAEEKHVHDNLLLQTRE